MKISESVLSYMHSLVNVKVDISTSILYTEKAKMSSMFTMYHFAHKKLYIFILYVLIFTKACDIMVNGEFLL